MELNSAIDLSNDLLARLDELREENSSLKNLVKDCQTDLAKYIVPDSGITEKEVISRLLYRLDGPQSRAALKEGK